MPQIKKYPSDEQRKEAVRARARSKYAENPQKALAKNKATRERNLEVYRERKKLAMRRARLLNGPKICARNRANRYADLDRYHQLERARYSKNRDKILKRNREQGALEIKARSIVSNHIRNERLIRQNCEVCKKKGVEEKGHAHHGDYLKPLEVHWLCRIHHETWHKVFIPENSSFERLKEIVEGI